MIDILNYLLALSAVFFGYRIYVSRRNGRAFKEIRPLTVSFGITLLLLIVLSFFFTSLSKLFLDISSIISNSLKFTYIFNKFISLT